VKENLGKLYIPLCCPLSVELYVTIEYAVRSSITIRQKRIEARVITVKERVVRIPLLYDDESGTRLIRGKLSRRALKR
jgi:hypothetical protein